MDKYYNNHLQNDQVSSETNPQLSGSSKSLTVNMIWAGAIVVVIIVIVASVLCVKRWNMNRDDRSERFLEWVVANRVEQHPLEDPPAYESRDIYELGTRHSNSLSIPERSYRTGRTGYRG